MQLGLAPRYANGVTPKTKGCGTVRKVSVILHRPGGHREEYDGDVRDHPVRCAMPLTLTVLRCPSAVRPERRSVRAGELSVGRGPGVDWILPDPEQTISRR